MGETWKDAGETVEHGLLYQRREHYPAQVTWWVEIITVEVDVQDDRIEFEVTGWGAGEESWAIDYVRLYGDLSRPEIWERLGEQLRRTFTRQDSMVMSVAQVCIDSGGHYTDEVYELCKKQGAGWAIPVKGSSQAGKPIATFPKTKNKKGVYLTLVGTDTAKKLIYHRFRILESGVGYCHWPDAKNRRNEALDCRVYSLTAVRILQQHRGINLKLLASGRPAPGNACLNNHKDRLPEKSVEKLRLRRVSRNQYLT